MTAALCPHGDVRAACLDCIEGPPDPGSIPAGAGQLLPAVRFTTARYDGRCPHRGCDITAGDRIGYSDELGAWVCGRCCT